MAKIFNTFDNVVKDNPDAHPLFRSNGGFQYTSPVFINMLKEHGMTQSMSRVHCSIDNEPMEGYWGIMKCEMYHYGRHYNTKDELIKAIDDWIHYYREDLELRHHMKSEVKHYLYKHQINIQYVIIKYKQEHYTSSTTLAA